jgi:hypothetical protein
MPTVKLPAPVPETVATTGETLPPLDAAEMIRETVLTLPYWKEGGDLKRIDAALEIEEALDLDPRQPKVSTEARNCLKDAMTLRLPNGNHASIPSSRQNRYYMRVFRAVLTAADEPTT